MLKVFQQASNLLSLDSDSIKNRSSNSIHSKQSIISNLMIPSNPQAFYTDFGYLLHPKTREPVQELTPYQYQIWNDSKTKYRLVVKSQKVGLSTSALLEDFQKA
ncbi:MAG: hypothetical protein MRJ93_01010 [Nitrososphaeraceae archaeon]|nr:hypothetical protein [Nitrososphaeraceae archaeon]